jgi:hypothetical protein
VVDSDSCRWLYNNAHAIFMLVTKATETRAEYAKYLLLFHAKNGYENAPRYYIIRALPLLFILYTLVFIPGNF